METKQTLRDQLEDQIQRLVIESAELLEQVQWETVEPDLMKVQQLVQNLHRKIQKIADLLGE